jgi:hypothetical protein
MANRERERERERGARHVDRIMFIGGHLEPYSSGTKDSSFAAVVLTKKRKRRPDIEHA